MQDIARGMDSVNMYIFIVLSYTQMDQLTAINARILARLTRLWHLQILLLSLVVFVLIMLFLVLPLPPLNT